MIWPRAAPKRRRTEFVATDIWQRWCPSAGTSLLPEENTAAVQATTATFDTWSADEASKTFAVRNEGGMYPNQIGTESKRSVTLAGDELKVSNPNPGSGGKAESVYKRVKGS